MDIDISVLRAARLALKAIRAREAEYADDVRDYYENGDGRSPEWVQGEDGHSYNVGGLGYRYPRCPHGMSLWTDYDNICGGCEDPTRSTRMAVEMGDAAVSESRKRIEASMPAVKAGCPRDIIDALMVWACEEPFQW